MQTVINGYKTGYSENRYKPSQTVTNRYKPLQTIYALNCHEPLHHQSDTTGYLLVQLWHSRVTIVDTLSPRLLEFNLEHYRLPS